MREGTSKVRIYTCKKCSWRRTCSALGTVLQHRIDTAMDATARANPERTISRRKTRSPLWIADTIEIAASMQDPAKQPSCRLS